MPYSSDKEVPKYVPAAKRDQWREVWNSVWQSTGSERRAFAEANSVAGPNPKHTGPPKTVKRNPKKRH